MSSAKLAAGLEDETRGELYRLTDFGARYIRADTLLTCIDGVKLAQIQPPFMFSFSKDDRKNKVQLRIKDSAWSNVSKRSDSIDRKEVNTDGWQIALVPES